MHDHPFPVCHPVVIAGHMLTDQIDISECFGLIKATVLAPCALYHPVLPVKMDKLVFPLCVKCCKDQSRQCTHSDKERQFTGTWFSEELTLALDKGYKIIRLHEVHHFPETRKDLFNDYIEKWLKIKIESSGYPEHVDTKKGREIYIERIRESQGIILDQTKIKINPGLKMIAKLMLNSLYGRMGQRDNYPETAYVSAVENVHLYNSIVLNRKKYEVLHIRKISDSMLQIWYRHRDVFKNKVNYDASVYVALMTSTRARIKLYHPLYRLDQRVLYMDTDSVKYIECYGENLVELADGLGCLTDEVENGYHISRFVSSGPKSLSFELVNDLDHMDKKYVIKLKGITLNTGNLEMVNFDEMVEILLNKNKVIRFINLSKITRNPSLWKCTIVWNRKRTSWSIQKGSCRKMSRRE